MKITTDEHRFAPRGGNILCEQDYIDKIICWVEADRMINNKQIPEAILNKVLRIIPYIYIIIQLMGISPQVERPTIRELKDIKL